MCCSFALLKRAGFKWEFLFFEFIAAWLLKNIVYVSQLTLLKAKEYSQANFICIEIIKVKKE